MEPNGSITTHLEDDESIRWEWEGGDIIEVSNYLLDFHPGYFQRTNDIVTIGPFTLKVINDDFSRSTFLAVRLDDRKSRLIAPGIIALDRLEKSAQLTRAYFVRLMNIWGLGHTPEGCYHQFRDIYFINWLVKKYADAKAKIQSRIR